MKKKITILFALPFLLLACNNEGKDSVEQADSANRAAMDSSAGPQTIATDEESSGFLVKAADGGMSEVELGQLAQQKATHPDVKNFAAMMVSDHSAANDQVKSLATLRNVTLPATVSEDHKKHMDDLVKKNGNAFDKAYMNMMEDDHQKTIDLFENASNKVNDAEIKTFADNTLPKLRMHLDSVKAIRKRLK